MSPSPSAGRRVLRVVAAILLFADAPIGLLTWLPTLPGDRRSFASAAEIEALAALDAMPDGTVLCTYPTGTRVPWLAGKTVYVGHWFMTIDCDAKARIAARFFTAGTPEDVRRKVLEISGARYVVEAAPERLLGGVDPRLGLKPLHRAGGVTVYEVPRAP